MLRVRLLTPQAVQLERNISKGLARRREWIRKRNSTDPADAKKEVAPRELAFKPTYVPEKRSYNGWSPPPEEPPMELLSHPVVWVVPVCLAELVSKCLLEVLAYSAVCGRGPLFPWCVLGAELHDSDG